MVGLAHIHALHRGEHRWPPWPGRCGGIPLASIKAKRPVFRSVVELQKLLAQPFPQRDAVHIAIYDRSPQHSRVPCLIRCQEIGTLSGMIDLVAAHFGPALATAGSADTIRSMSPLAPHFSSIQAKSLPLCCRLTMPPPDPRI